MAKLTDFIDPDVIAEYLETSEDILAGKVRGRIVVEI